MTLQDKDAIRLAEAFQRIEPATGTMPNSERNHESWQKAVDCTAQFVQDFGRGGAEDFKRRCVYRSKAALKAAGKEHIT